MDDLFAMEGDDDLLDEEGLTAGEVLHAAGEEGIATGGGGPPPSWLAARRRNRSTRTAGSFQFNTGMPPAVDPKALFPCSDSSVRPQVCSLIAQVKLGNDIRVDLTKFATHVRDVELHPTRKSAVMRLREPKCTLTVRMCGTITLTGCKSLAAAKAAASIAVKLVRRVMGWTAKDLHTVTFTLHTSTVRFDLKHPVRLEALAAKHPQEVSYEPESFCAANVRMTGIIDEDSSSNNNNNNNNNGNNSHGATAAETGGAKQQQRWCVTAAVFSSGKVVLLGPCSSGEVMAAYNALLPKLQPFAENVPESTLFPPASKRGAEEKKKKKDEKSAKKKSSSNKKKGNGKKDDADDNNVGSGGDEDENDEDNNNADDDPFAVAGRMLNAEAAADAKTKQKKTKSAPSSKASKANSAKAKSNAPAPATLPANFVDDFGIDLEDDELADF